MSEILTNVAQSLPAVTGPRGTWPEASANVV